MKNLLSVMNKTQIIKIPLDNFDINIIIKNKPIPINYYNNTILKMNKSSINCNFIDCQRLGRYNIKNTVYCWIHCQKIE